jgi:5-(carboxyamino)imidazole ribonucleotide synthase
MTPPCPPLLPPATIGIIGGGQLGMMLVREAQRMGYRTIVWDPDPACPAHRLADETLSAPFNDTTTARRLAAIADTVTYEFENIDAAAVRLIEQTRPVFPGSAILAIAQNRALEKDTLRKLGFSVARYEVVPADGSLDAAAARIGLPVVAKTGTAGYDGKGQTILRSEADVRAWAAPPQHTQGDLVLEEFLTLEAELSVLVARGTDGTIRTFPPAENEHRQNILHLSRVPTRLTKETSAAAVALARRIAEAFDLRGLLCVELFLTADGRLLVNELAPRPHNSGHYSLDACDCSQFEMLIRVMCGLPLPEPFLLTPCAMVNLLGKHVLRAPLDRLLSVPGTRVHLYGKQRNEPHRKMGHVTILAPDPGEVTMRIQQLQLIIGE